ncbi:MAG TPA: cytochrome c3 family protein [Nitrospiraceae bacterium]|nr:cytochrome c3 family protein [Nitrospiraceae bacterium]
MRDRGGKRWAGIGAGLALLLAAVRAEAQSLAPEVELCLGCHSDRSLELNLKSGERRSLFVDGQAFARSIHGDKLRCTDCHSDIETYPHPERAFTNLREFTLAYYESCKGCHFENYTKTLDSVHFAVLSKGDLRAPLCVDCHGAHDVENPNVPRSRISRTCARCHGQVSQEYVRSVHGKALVEDENVDVPVCSDCHRSHNIEDPRTAAFHLKTPELCARCHADETLMKKYGLSTNVLQTYLKDFHGMTASFYKEEQATPAALTAVCTDCHGVHDILPVKDPRSAVMKANLVKVCRKCHADATENFPGAWLSHYEPSTDKAPLVYYVKLFYQIFIPFVVLGLALQVLLHLWRVVVNR